MSNRTTLAFTLVEVLVVMAILLVLMGIVLTATGGAKDSAKERVCASNLRQIGLAIGMYRADFEGKDPTVGSGLPYDAAGLPAPGEQFLGFTKQYLKDRRILVCPAYRQYTPDLITTYQWVPDKELNHSKQYRFSTVSAQRGMSIPIAICVEHNPKFDGTEPRWDKKKVIVLRLDLSVSTRMVPVRSRWPTF